LKTLYPDYPFKPNYISLKGGKLHFVDEGEGPVIVMVHGNPTWSFYFRNLISLLSLHYRVVAIDHMGCGLSDKPQSYSYTLNQHIENLDTLLNFLRIDRFSLIVHDWGGPIGIGCGIRHLDALEKIVVMNSAAFRSSNIPFRISLCRVPLLGEILVRLFNGFAWPATFMAVEKKLEKDVSSAYISPYDNWTNRVAVYNFVKDIPMRQEHPSYDHLVEIEQKLEYINELKIPLLLLWGGKDFCFNDSFYGEWNRRFPGAEKHYFADGGHYVLEDKFSEIGPIVCDFFKGGRAADE
jgi:pimeloyl-ACP methyl ester carboxylesterase